MAKVGFPIPTKENELRRALLPEDIGGIKAAGELVFEKGYGSVLGYSDDDYQRCGAGIAERSEVCRCPVICNAKPAITDEYFQQDKKIFGWIHAVQGRAITDALIEHKMTAIAWEDMFEGGRHCFWRNNEIAGEAAVMHAFLQWGRLPYESTVAVIGRGNCAMGAVRALERFGGNVTIYGRKTVGLLREEIDRYDVIINAVLWDVFRKDHIIYEQDMDKMRPGSLIIDISCDEAMGIESSRPTTIKDPVYWHKGILHYAVDHTPALLYRSASRSISSVVSRFIDFLADEKPNPVIERATIIRDGSIIDERITRFQNRA